MMVVILNLILMESCSNFPVGVVRRNPNDIPDELKGYAVTDDYHEVG